jgi:hypothetical protein
MMAQSFEDSAPNLWKTISDFGGISRYCPSVSDSTADGAEPGTSHRTLTVANADGSTFQYRERLEELDQDEMRLSYSMPDAGVFPMRDGYRSTMQVTERGDGRCLLTWSAVLEPRDVTPGEVTAFLGTVYQGVFDGLRALHH